MFQSVSLNSSKTLTISEMQKQVFHIQSGTPAIILRLKNAFRFCDRFLQVNPFA